MKEQEKRGKGEEYAGEKSDAEDGEGRDEL